MYKICLKYWKRALWYCCNECRSHICFFFFFGIKIKLNGITRRKIFVYIMQININCGERLHVKNTLRLFRQFCLKINYNTEYGARYSESSGFKFGPEDSALRNRFFWFFLFRPGICRCVTSSSATTTSTFFSEIVLSAYAVICKLLKATLNKYVHKDRLVFRCVCTSIFTIRYRRFLSTCREKIMDRK